MLSRGLRALIVAVLLPACASQTLAQKPPGWFADPPRDTEQSWYGVGEGPDPETARRSALRAVAARLRSTISGQVSSQVTDANGRVDRRAEVKVSEDVLKTEFSQVQIEATAKSSVGYLVLVKVDRPAFLRDTRAQLEVVAKPIAEAEGALGGASTLEQYLSLRRIAAELEQAVTLSQLLTGAGAEAEGRQGYARFSALQKRSQQVASALVFELRVRPEDTDIAKVVSGLLADQGMRSATVRTAGASVLSVDSSVRQDELFGDKLVKLTVRFSVVDDQGRAVASREHVVSGGSRYDFRGAREAALNKLSAALRQQGVLAAFGFKS